MIDKRFACAIAIIVGQFFTFVDILLGDKNQMRSIFVSYNFGGEITVTRMIDQTSQFARFGGGVDAVSGMEFVAINFDSTELDGSLWVWVNLPPLLFFVLEVIHVTADGCILGVNFFASIRFALFN